MSGLIEADPINLISVLRSERVLPGDVLELQPGNYAWDWIVSSSLSGTAGNPVIMRPKTPGTVTLEGSLTINADYFEVYDMNTRDARSPRAFDGTKGITIKGVGVGVYGCIVIDLLGNGFSWFLSGAGEVCENVILNNFGHAIYTHNELGGARLIARNVFWNQLAQYNLHIYSASTNHLRDYTVEDNITCGDPVHTGGGGGLIDFIYRRNVQYGDYCQLGRYSGANANVNGQILDNVFIDLSAYSVNADTVPAWENLTESGNTVYGGQPAARAGYTLLAQPATWSKMIPFTKSARWAASLAIFNRDSAATVSVDLTGLANGNYKFRNAQNPAETSAFTYAGGSVDVPTNWTNAQPIGGGLQGTTWPIFGGLVIEKA